MPRVRAIHIKPKVGGRTLTYEHVEFSEDGGRLKVWRGDQALGSFPDDEYDSYSVDE